jgi:hypothetical protein
MCVFLHLLLTRLESKQRADIARTPIIGNALADEIARSQARFGKELLVPDFLYFAAKFLDSLGLNQVEWAVSWMVLSWMVLS